MKQVTDKYVQSIYNESDPDVKREMCLHIVNNFEHKKKLTQFLDACDGPTTCFDTLATNIKFVAEGLRVI